MSEEFVRKDVFDANMQRIEALMEKNLAKQEAIATEIKGDIKALSNRLDGKIETLSSRIDSLQHQRYWDIAWFAIAVTSVVAIIQYIKG